MSGLREIVERGVRTALATEAGRALLLSGPARAGLTHGNVALRHLEGVVRPLQRSHRAVARGNPRNPTLGVAMMAQDSAHLLPVALGADLLALVDDVVLIDGGSQDDTAAVARSLGARVVHAPFAGFGPQQTRAVRASRADWVLVLDTDEVAGPGLLDAAPDLIRSRRHTGWWLPRRWLVGSPDAPQWIASAPHWPDLQARLARRTPDLRYVGPAHPTLDAAVRGPWGVAPRRAALLHLDFLLNDRVARERKVAARGGLEDFAGTEGYYLWEDGGVRLRPAGEAAPAVRRALARAGLSSGGRSR